MKTVIELGTEQGIQWYLKDSHLHHFQQPWQVSPSPSVSDFQLPAESKTTFQKLDSDTSTEGFKMTKLDTAELGGSDCDAFSSSAVHDNMSELWYTKSAVAMSNMTAMDSSSLKGSANFSSRQSRQEDTADLTSKKSANFTDSSFRQFNWDVFGDVKLWQLSSVFLVQHFRDDGRSSWLFNHRATVTTHALLSHPMPTYQQHCQHRHKGGVEIRRLMPFKPWLQCWKQWDGFREHTLRWHTCVPVLNTVQTCTGRHTLSLCGAYTEHTCIQLTFIRGLGGPAVQCSNKLCTATIRGSRALI